MFKTPAPRTLPHLQTIVQPITAQPNCTDSKIKKAEYKLGSKYILFSGLLKKPVQQYRQRKTNQRTQHS